MCVHENFHDKIVLALGFIPHKVGSHVRGRFLVSKGLASFLKTCLSIIKIMGSKYPAHVEKDYICFQGMATTKT